MSYRITAAIAEDPGFRARVRACLLDVARDISNEDWTSPAPDVIEGPTQVDASFNRTARIQLAFVLAADPRVAELPFAWVCAANAQIQSGATLADDGTLTIDESDGKADDAALRLICAGTWDRVARLYAVRPGANA